MAHTHADVLEVHLHDDTVSLFEDVAYTPWSSKSGPAVTVFRDGVELAVFADIRHTVAERRH